MVFAFYSKKNENKKGSWTHIFNHFIILWIIPNQFLLFFFHFFQPLLQFLLLLNSFKVFLFYFCIKKYTSFIFFNLATIKLQSFKIEFQVYTVSTPILSLVSISFHQWALLSQFASHPSVLLYESHRHTHICLHICVCIWIYIRHFFYYANHCF